MELYFEVEGSRGDIYEIVASDEDGHLTITCECGDSRTGNGCKHRAALIRGDDDALISDNYEEVHVLIQAVQGTDIAKLGAEVSRLIMEADRVQSELRRIRSDIAKAKKPFGAAMRGLSA